ncbi:hypothetical protein Bca4012_026081 [Brassica carinata]
MFIFFDKTVLFSGGGALLASPSGLFHSSKLVETFSCACLRPNLFCDFSPLGFIPLGVLGSKSVNLLQFCFKILLIYGSLMLHV